MFLLNFNGDVEVVFLVWSGLFVLRRYLFGSGHVMFVGLG